MDQLLQQLATAQKSIFLVTGVLIAVLYYFSGFDDGGKLDTQLKGIRVQIHKSESELAEAQKVASEKENFREEFNFVSEQLAAAIEYLPTKIGIQDILKKISSEARAAGVKLVLVEPKDPEKKAFYEELLMQVELEGTYAQLTLFLSYISKIRRILNIRDLELKTKTELEESILLSMKGTLVAYKYLGDQVANEAEQKQGAKGAKGK